MDAWTKQQGFPWVRVSSFSFPCRVVRSLASPYLAGDTALYSSKVGTVPGYGTLDRLHVYFGSVVDPDPVGSASPGPRPDPAFLNIKSVN